MTPEGRVKAKLKKILADYKPRIYTHWPVLRGMGAPDLDCNIVYTGVAISIECKAPGEKFTKRQVMTATDKLAAGCIVLGFRGSDADIEALVEVLGLLDEGNGYEAAFLHAAKHTEEEGYYG